MRPRYKKMFEMLKQHYQKVKMESCGIEEETDISKDAHQLAESIIKTMLNLEPGVRNMAVILAAMAILRGYIMKPLREIFEMEADELLREFNITFDQDYWMGDHGSVACAILFFLHGKKYPHNPFEELEKERKINK